MPFVFIVNAPSGSNAHTALLKLLHFFAEEKEYSVAHIILMGAAVETVVDPHMASAYAAAAKSLNCDIALCGMSAKNHQIAGDQVPKGFALTGFMDILHLMHKQNEYKVINW